MKNAILSIIALSVLNSVAAQPHRHRHQHEKRDYVTVTSYVTASAPDAIVYVDGNGNPVSTAYANQAPPTPAPAAPAASAATPEVQPAPPASSASAPEIPAPQPQSAAPAPQAAAPAPQAAAPAPQVSAFAPEAPASPPSSGYIGKPHVKLPPFFGSNSGYGVAYSAYNLNGCKTADEVNSDIQKLAGYTFVRIYGTDCDQVKNVINAAKPMGLKVMTGIYDLSQVTQETQAIVDAVQSTNDNWESIDTVSVGNEDLNRGVASIGDVLSAVASSRAQLRAAGYNGPVVHVDTFNQYLANPELCTASDYAAANCHAFFNGAILPELAGDWVLHQAQLVSLACGGMNVTITESGWPWNGDANERAIPSRINQRIALNSLKRKFSSNLVLFSAFNDPWKTDSTGTFGAEKFWGFVDGGDDGEAGDNV